MRIPCRHLTRLLLSSGVAAAVLVLGAASSVGAQGLMLTGYADLEFSVEGVGSDDRNVFFDNHHFNLIGLGNIIGDLFAAGEVEFEHGGAEIALEYGYLMYTGIPHARIVAGKFIMPFGRFNQIHPSWISKVPGRPEGFSRVLPVTYTDVGVWVSGGLPLGAGSLDRVTYDVVVVNGLQGDPGADIRGMRLEGEPAEEENDAKSYGGRLGAVLGNSGLDFAVSVLRGKYNQEEGLYLTFVGADAAFQRSGFELRGEWVTAFQEVPAEDELRKTAFYLQGSYLALGRVEPTVRFSWQDFPAAQEATRDLWRIEIGGNYYVSPSSSIRLFYRHDGERKADPEPENDSIIAQFNVAF